MKSHKSLDAMAMASERSAVVVVVGLLAASGGGKDVPAAAIAFSNRLYNRERFKNKLPTVELHELL